MPVDSKGKSELELCPVQVNATIMSLPETPTKIRNFLLFSTPSYDVTFLVGKCISHPIAFTWRQVVFLELLKLVSFCRA